MTYALIDFTFLLAFISKMRSRGMSSPPRAVTFSISDASAGRVFASGVKR